MWISNIGESISRYSDLEWIIPFWELIFDLFKLKITIQDNKTNWILRFQLIWWCKVEAVKQLWAVKAIELLIDFTKLVCISKPQKMCIIPSCNIFYNNWIPTHWNANTTATCHMENEDLSHTQIDGSMASSAIRVSTNIGYNGDFFKSFSFCLKASMLLQAKYKHPQSLKNIVGPGFGDLQKIRVLSDIF